MQMSSYWGSGTAVGKIISRPGREATSNLSFLSLNRSAIGNLYPIYRQYSIHCSALFVASLVKRCSVEPNVWSSSPRIDKIKIIIFFYLYVLLNQ